MALAKVVEIGASQSRDGFNEEEEEAVDEGEAEALTLYGHDGGGIKCGLRLVTDCTVNLANLEILDDVNSKGWC